MQCLLLNTEWHYHLLPFTKKKNPDCWKPRKAFLFVLINVILQQYQNLLTIKPCLFGGAEQTNGVIYSILLTDSCTSRIQWQGMCNHIQIWWLQSGSGNNWSRAYKSGYPAVNPKISHGFLCMEGQDCKWDLAGLKGHKLKAWAGIIQGFVLHYMYHVYCITGKETSAVIQHENSSQNTSAHSGCSRDISSCTWSWN